MGAFGDISPAVILYDASGVAIAVQDGVAVPANTAGAIGAGKDAGGIGRLFDVSLDSQGRRRLLVTQGDNNTGGAPGVPIPVDPNRIVVDTVKLTGSPNLLVNGSVTPKVFTYPADPTKDISIVEIRFVFAANSIAVGASKFGNAPALTNGVLLEILSDTYAIKSLGNIKINEDFLSLISAPSNLIFDQTGSNDYVVASITLSGVTKLKAGTSNVLQVTIRDNLTASSFLYFRCYVYGVKDP